MGANSVSGSGNAMRLRTLPGRQIALGLIVFAIMTYGLWEISEGISGREPATFADSEISARLHTHARQPLTTAMFAVTTFGSTQWVTWLTAAFIAYFIVRRRFYWMLAFATSVFGGMLLNKLLKYFFHRTRPFFQDPLLTLTSYSFPSGHTMMATVLYGAIAAYLLSRTNDWRQRLLIILAAALLILLVAFSRVYLGAHYLTDVLGAMAEGLAWLSLCLTTVFSIWRYRHAPPS
jgi:membrane-associated phospholipid phosphatase